ncbi:hypothetical protein HDV00_002727 [Rhizophlyctis rosea]|nr:hypothetical protein HDV00_002727 [Rhizophlyctis rosea]
MLTADPAYAAAPAAPEEPPVHAVDNQIPDQADSPSSLHERPSLTPLNIPPAPSTPTYIPSAVPPHSPISDAGTEYTSYTAVTATTNATRASTKRKPVDYSAVHSALFSRRGDGYETDSYQGAATPLPQDGYAPGGEWVGFSKGKNGDGKSSRGGWAKGLRISRGRSRGGDAFDAVGSDVEGGGVESEGEGSSSRSSMSGTKWMKEKLVGGKKEKLTGDGASSQRASSENGVPEAETDSLKSKRTWTKGGMIGIGRSKSNDEKESGLEQSETNNAQSENVPPPPAQRTLPRKPAHPEDNTTQQQSPLKQSPTKSSEEPRQSIYLKARFGAAAATGQDVQKRMSGAFSNFASRIRKVGGNEQGAVAPVAVPIRKDQLVGEEPVQEVPQQQLEQEQQQQQEQLQAQPQVQSPQARPPQAQSLQAQPPQAQPQSPPQVQPEAHAQAPLDPSTQSPSTPSLAPPTPPPRKSVIIMPTTPVAPTSPPNADPTDDHPDDLTLITSATQSRRPSVNTAPGRGANASEVSSSHRETVMTTGGESVTSSRFGGRARQSPSGPRKLPLDDAAAVWTNVMKMATPKAAPITKGHTRIFDQLKNERDAWRDECARLRGCAASIDELRKLQREMQTAVEALTMALEDGRREGGEREGTVGGGDDERGSQGPAVKSEEIDFARRRIGDLVEEFGKSLDAAGNLNISLSLPLTPTTEFSTTSRSSTSTNPSSPSASRRKSAPLPIPPTIEDGRINVDRIRAVLAKARGEQPKVGRKSVDEMQRYIDLPLELEEESGTPFFVGTPSISRPVSPHGEVDHVRQRSVTPSQHDGNADTLSRPTSSDEFAEMLMKEIERKLEIEAAAEEERRRKGEEGAHSEGGVGGGEGDGLDGGKGGRKKVEIFVPRVVWERVKKGVKREWRGEKEGVRVEG